MRKLTLFFALALASCGGNQAANNAAVSEDSGAGDVTAGNDTTAIDAATGEAANMAEDVNYTFDENTTNAGNASSTASPARPPKKPAPAPAHQPDEPATNNTATE
jgi:hypothetical protein